MYLLLQRYFANTTRRQFDDDLAEKEWAILLRGGPEGEVQGFSTLMRCRLSDEQHQPVVAFFSGDTIIDRNYWGEFALPRLWGRHVLGLAEQSVAARVYWFLISSGYKTYRYLPLFFREFYPTWQDVTPTHIGHLMNQLGRLKFGEAYDGSRGVIRLAHSTPLREGIAEITPERLRDPHVRFFLKANPGHALGDELACLAELSRSNLTPAALRMLGG